MLSNARGKHSSPGVYIEEIDKSYATKSLGITTLGVVGETLKGPAFEPVRISDWAEFQEYFGGTSTEKFNKGLGYPKYELPYIAKSYLQESKNLEVCRVLGFSGYDAGKAFVIYGYSGASETSATTATTATTSGTSATTAVTKYPIAVLRSKAVYNIAEDANSTVCNPSDTYDKLSFLVSGVTMSGYTPVNTNYASCSNTIETGSTETLSVGVDRYGRFNLTITGPDNLSETAAVSLNPNDKDYIVNILGMKPNDGEYSIFVEELFDLAHIEACKSGLYNMVNVETISTINDYKSMYREAVTPWFVSELKGSGTRADIKKLFRFHTISDGNAANTQVKISISNILPDEGLFDVAIRDYYDSDNSPIILEKYNRCNMVPGDVNYVGLKIGTFNGDYDNKSKYVTIEVIENDTTEACVPCGFLGYPLRKYGNDYEVLKMAYNTKAYETLKPNRQYFGLSDLAGVDSDVFFYKGVSAYTTSQKTADGYTTGFHLDSRVNSAVTYTVDGEPGYTFTSIDEYMEGFDAGAGIIASESAMKDSLFEDKRYRKFTCYPYGGFDGWDVYRAERTNTSEFRANKYKGKTFSNQFDASLYGISGKYNNSDYYAYLAGYKQFDNPSKIKINLLATPGIDYVNNIDLFNEVLDIVEESRQGDCLYIATTPDVTREGYEIDAEDAVANLEAQEINTSYAATYYPWVKYYDAANKKYITLPVTKDVVRNFAYTDNVSHPWFASAGMSRGNVECTKARHFTKLEEEDVLYDGMINPVKSFGGEGVKLWGNKTMYREDTPLNRINVRRLMIRIKDLVMSAARQLIFEQNDNAVEAQFRSIVDPILANAKQNRGISDYRIKTDTSAEARDRKELPAAIYVKPINCLEYIPITFTIYPEGAKFDE
jgi:hypothetical protein